MVNIPTAHSSESLERFIQHILDAPTPSNVTRQYLKDNGFPSGNDPELRHIFRLLGFLDDEDTPTTKWEEFKAEGVSVLRAAVEKCYAKLFALYPDAAFNRTDEELKVWFRPPITGASKTSVERAIRTFRKFCVVVGMLPDNRVKNDEALSNTQTIPPSFKPSTEKKQIVLQIPQLENKAEYQELFEAIKEVFYS